ncbi:MAG: hypothetical protein ACXVP5_12010 [Tumebacillaceae bacterium]
MTDLQKNVQIPDAYHPNTVELNVDEARQAALESLNLSQQVVQGGLDSLTSEQAAEVGSRMAEYLNSCKSNISQRSE